MKLVLLGTTGYHPNDQRHTACLMIPEAGIILDAGTGMFRARDWIATRELNILISHAHLDHVVGLTYLFDVVAGKNVNRVTVHGAETALQAVANHLFAEALFPVRPPFECQVLSGEMQLAGARLRSFPLEHPGGTLGFRLDWPGHSMAYVTDTTAAADAAYVDHLRDVDLLVHECYFPDADAELARTTGHSYTSEVLRVAARARARRLVLVHVNPLATDDDPLHLRELGGIFPHAQVGSDGLVLDF